MQVGVDQVAQKGGWGALWKMGLWKSMLRLFCIGVFVPVVFLLGCQSSLIYHPNAYRAEYEERLVQMGGERLKFSTSQGAQTAFFIPPCARVSGLPETVWLCFAGNGSLALDWLHAAEVWDDRFAYLLVDYPSYGDCEGKPTPARIRESSEAAFAALAGRLGLTEEALRGRSLVLGHSLGSAVALMAAEDLGIERGVLISPFSSMTEMGRLMLGWPLCHLNLHRYDNRRTLERVLVNEEARFVIYHGSEDEVIPVRMGRELAKRDESRIAFHEVAGAHHNDVLRLAGNRVGESMAELAKGR
jgi:pimeloyl-ACP methyl ester carboxylesterase